MEKKKIGVAYDKLPHQLTKYLHLKKILGSSFSKEHEHPILDKLRRKQGSIKV